MKELDCVMKIMTSWMTLDELEGAKQEDITWAELVQCQKINLSTNINLY